MPPEKLVHSIFANKKAAPKDGFYKGIGFCYKKTSPEQGG